MSFYGLGESMTVCTSDTAVCDGSVCTFRVLLRGNHRDIQDVGGCYLKESSSNMTSPFA